MTLTNRLPRTIPFALILFLLVIIPSEINVFGKKRPAAKSARSSRSEKSRKSATRDRRSSRRERLSARNARGGKTRLSKKEARLEARRDRNRVAREQSNSLAALQRRLGRKLTKRERNAEMRRISGSRRREILEARRRAEAARRAAIARQLAFEKALRDEVQTFIGRDDTRGEDMEVRRAAVNALGNHAGTVVVMDPQSGKIYSIVNQEWALRRGFKPCSTIKLVTGVAGLEEKMISPFDSTNISDHYKLDLTDALAYSNNTYFQHIGGQVGFDKMMNYAREMGLGEKTGVNVPSEYSGRLPAEKNGWALNRMSSHGDDFEVTALQLGSLVSSMANGGKVFVPYVPRTPEDSHTKLRRQLNISAENLRRMVPGMVGAVNYGSGKKAYDPLQTVAGKTGTCIGQGAWVGLFASYAPLANPRLAVVVITRGSDARKHLPAAVAGRIYRELGPRFGAPIHLQVASGNDRKASELNEEDKDADEAAAAEAEAAIAAEENSASATQPAAIQSRPTQPLVNQPLNSNVKPVLKSIDLKRPAIEAQRSAAGKAAVPAAQPDDRQRRTPPIDR